MVFLDKLAHKEREETKVCVDKGLIHDINGYPILGGAGPGFYGDRGFPGAPGRAGSNSNRKSY